MMLTTATPSNCGEALKLLLPPCGRKLATEPQGNLEKHSFSFEWGMVKTQEIG